MEAQTQTLDPERQLQAKGYARIRRRLWLVDLALAAAYSLAWLVFGLSNWLRDSLLAFTDSPWLLVPLFVVVFGGVYWLLNLPLGYYSGFVLPHRYGLPPNPLPTGSSTRPRESRSARCWA